MTTQARMLNFVENLERKDLNILEEARALGRLYPDGVSLRGGRHGVEAADPLGP